MPRHYLKNYFQFTRGETTGILVLFFILLVLIVVRIFLPGISPKASIDFYSYQQELQEWLRSDSSGRSSNNDSIQPHPLNLKPEPVFSFFNPNKVTRQDLKLMGLTGKPANTWLKYLKKGGHFNKKEDLKKVYGIGDSVYLLLEKYIHFDRPAAKIQRVISLDTLSGGSQESSLMIDLNRIDSTGLTLISGLGPKLSGRIIRYRDWLGGFYSSEQLLEIYGFPSEIYRRDKNKFLTDTLILRKMNLNTVSMKSLSSHPYLNPYQARAITKYREWKGAFNTVNEILINHLIPTHVYERIRVYLKVLPDSLIKQNEPYKTGN